MSAHENSFLLRKALIHGLPSNHRIEEVEQFEHSEDLYTPLPTGDRKLRKQMRLMFKAMLDSHLKSEDASSREWKNDLRLVPSWPSNQKSSVIASERLLQIADWSEEEQGVEQASSWTQAARIAEWMMEDYSGWPHFDESYETAAGWFFASLRCGGWNDEIFSQLLKDLHATE